MKRTVLIFLQMLAMLEGMAQMPELLYKEDKNSFRGLSVVSDAIIWVSGARGTIGRSIDSGKSWSWFTIPHCEKRELRDIAAFNENTAIVIAIDTPAQIYKTNDGGKNWQKVYENKLPGMFLDAIDFLNHQLGYVVGDPINNRLFILQTTDGGNNWKELPPHKKPIADSGEAFFAASGSNVHVQGKKNLMYVTGGKNSRFFKNGIPSPIPIIKGKESTGANAIAVFSTGKMRHTGMIYIVGGDFNNPSSSFQNAAYSTDEGKHWQLPQKPPYGYKSSICFLNADTLISCGTSGIDISTDKGQHWELLSRESYHVCAAAPSGKWVYLAGSGGKIAKLAF